MSDPVLVAVAALNASPTVTGLIGSKISPVIAAQNTEPPYVTLISLSTDPVNDLVSFSNLDQCRVIVTAWAETYSQAQAIGSACRTAMVAAGHICETRNSDQYDLDPDPGLFHIEHQFLMWL